MKKSIITTALFLFSILAFGQVTSIVGRSDTSITAGKVINTSPGWAVYSHQDIPLKYDTIPCLLWISDTSAKHITGLVFQVRGFVVRHKAWASHPDYAILNETPMEITDKYLDHKKNPFPPRFMIPFCFETK